MGSLVFGYSFTAFSVVNPLIVENTQFTSHEDRLSTISFLNNLPILAALISYHSFN